MLRTLIGTLGALTVVVATPAAAATVLDYRIVGPNTDVIVKVNTVTNEIFGLVMPGIVDGTAVKAVAPHPAGPLPVSTAAGGYDNHFNADFDPILGNFLPGYGAGFKTGPVGDLVFLQYFDKKYDTYIGEPVSGNIWNARVDPASAYAIALYAPKGVPEPATWAMMILGIGAVGANLRRSRRSATLATA